MQDLATTYTTFHERKAYAVPHGGMEGCQRLGRAEIAVEQAMLIPWLESDGILDVRLTSRDSCDVPGMDQEHLQTVSFQPCEGQHPIHPRGCH